MTRSERAFSATSVRYFTEPTDTLFVLPGFRDAHRHMPHGFPNGSSEAELRGFRDLELRKLKIEAIAEVREFGCGALVPWPERPAWVETALQGIIGAARRGEDRGYGWPLQEGEDAGARVAALAAAGADFIKIFATATGRFDRETALERTMSRSEIHEVAAAAGELGLPVSAHCHGGPALLDCLDAGVSGIEHALYVEPDEVSACIAAGVGVTLTPGVYIHRHGDRIVDDLRRLVDSCADPELRLGVGTDAPEQTILAQVHVLHALGMDLARAMRAATTIKSDPSCVLFYDADPLHDPVVLSHPIGVAFASASESVSG